MHYPEFLYLFHKYNRNNKIEFMNLCLKLLFPMKTKLLYLHFVLLVVVVLNLGCKVGFDFGLHHYLYFALRVISYLSGLALFILYCKPFQKKIFYFSLYWFLPILVGISKLIDGILFGVVASIFWISFSPNRTILSDKDYEVTAVASGLLASCCHYEINKNYYFMFEKRIVQLREVDEIQLFGVDETKKRAYFSGKYIDLP